MGGLNQTNNFQNSKNKTGQNFEGATIGVVNNYSSKNFEIKIDFDFDWFYPSPPTQELILNQIINCIIQNKEFEFTSDIKDKSDLFLFYLYSIKLKKFIEAEVKKWNDNPSNRPILNKPLFHSFVNELQLEIYQISQKDDQDEFKIIRNYITNNNHLQKIDDDIFFFEYLNSLNFDFIIKIDNQFFIPDTIIDFFELKIESVENLPEVKNWEALYSFYKTRAEGKNKLLERGELEDYIYISSHE
jgi:hypothetical protein